MGVDIRKIKARNPQRRGNVRGGADPGFIKPSGSGMQTSNSGQHGSASGPNRMVPSSKSPLGPGPSNKPMAHKPSLNTSSESAPRMERYNTEWQRSRDRGECVPKDLYGRKKESPLVKAALASHNSAPYGRTRPAPSSTRHAAAGAAASPNKGAGRARGVNIWYPNIGTDASADSGDSQRRGNKESESVGTQNSDAGSTPD